MIKRNYFDILKKELNSKEILVLVGSRQVGKTTLMKELLKLVEDKAIFLSFDDIEVFEQFETDIKFFEEKYVKAYDYIFIDEIQYSKNSGKFLKYLYDKYEKKFIVSGSSVPELSINSLQYLVGRVKLVTIYPISFEEFLEFKSDLDYKLLSKIRTQKQLKPLEKYFEEYLKFGGYPNVILKDNLMEKEKILKDLVDIYLLKEIKEILQYSNIFEYSNLMKRLALTDGCIANKSSISAEIDVNNQKIAKMIEVLENTYLISRLKPFYSNKIKELIKSPKVYFQDLGIKNALTNNFNELTLKQDKGEILESFTYSILKLKDYNISFWNYKNKFEMDFVIEKNGDLIGIECKSKLLSSKLTNSQKFFIENQKPKKVIILNQSIDDEFVFKGVKVLFSNYLNLNNLV
jgi:predicted AAA+ superfamily ATPase